MSAAVKALGPQGTNNWLHRLWRDLRQRADWFFSCTKLKCIFMSDLPCLLMVFITFQGTLNYINFWPKCWSGLILTDPAERLLLSTSTCVCLFFLQWAALVCLGWVFWGPWHFQEFVISARGLSLSLIDKWGSKHGADEPVSLQWLRTSLISLHTLLLQRKILLPLINF